MAGIAGQPAPKPQNVPSPVPGEDEGLSFDDFLARQPQPKIDASVDIPFNQITHPAIESFAQALPAAGGIVGGIAGLPMGGILGSAGGAALGASAGTALRLAIEKGILAKQDEDTSSISAALKEIGWEGAKEGLMQGAGGLAFKGIAKGGSLLANTKAGQVVSEYVSHLSSPLTKWVKEEYDQVVEPILTKLSKVMPARNIEESGDTVKELLKTNINNRYGKFKQAYESLDNIAESVPLDRTAINNFTLKLAAEAKNLSSSDEKLMLKMISDISRSQHGLKLKNTVKTINDNASKAFANNQTGLGKQYANLANKLDDFYDDQVTALANKYMRGEISANDSQFLVALMNQRSIVEANPSKYAKSLASDYLKSKEIVRNDYAGFKSFLGDLSEQTKIKMGKKGPMRFLDEIDSIPSEKLMERMFDPKNAQALRKMKQETPEVFNEVVGAKIKNMLSLSSPTGELDVVALRSFQKAINKMPEPVRNLVFDSADVTEMNRILNSPKIEKLGHLQVRGENFLRGWLGDLVEVSKIGSKKIAATGVGKLTGKAISTVAKRETGRAITSPLFDAFGGGKL